MAMFLNNQTGDEAELATSRIGRMESDEPTSMPTISDSLFPDNDDDDADETYTEENETDDEPTDEDGDPTGEHDHHQDDNYALGGHVTRSGT